MTSTYTIGCAVLVQLTDQVERNWMVKRVQLRTKRPISIAAMVALAAACAGNHDMGPGQVDGTTGGQDGAQP